MVFLIILALVHAWWCGACGGDGVLYVVFFNSHRVFGLVGQLASLRCCRPVVVGSTEVTILRTIF